MNVNFDKIDNVNAVLTISFVEDDYQKDVKKELAQIGRERPLKGFRPGHVPAGLLQKHFGNQVLAEVIDRKLSRSLTDYIINNEIPVLGEPMLSNDTKVDLTTQKEFSFKFDLGLAPQFDLKLDKSIKIPYYNIEVTQEMLDKQNDANKKRFGKQVPGEVAAEDSLIRGAVAELNEDGTVKEDGITAERTIVSPQYLKDEDEKAKFIGKKVGDEIVFNPKKAFGDNKVDLTSFLNIDRDHEDVTSDFKFTVSEVLVNEDAELNQELFDNVLGKDQAKTEEEYFAKLKEMMQNQLKNDSNYRFTIDAEKVLKEKVGKLELPEDFLKRFLAARNNNKDIEELEKNYDNTSSQLQWQLIKEKIAKDLNVKVEVEDKLRLARFFAAQQFAQYGMTNLPEDVIDRYAHELLENKDNSSDIENRAFEDKVFAAIKDAVELDEKNVSVDDFNKLFEADK